MRTTVDLPDELVRAARVRAAESDESLKELFTRALANELGRAPRRARRALPVIGSSRPGASVITAEQLGEALEIADADALP